MSKIDEKSQEWEELISEVEKDKSTEAEKAKEKRDKEIAEIKAAAPIKEEIKETIDGIKKFWIQVPPLDNPIILSFYRTNDSRYSIVATEDYRIECRGSGPNWAGSVDIFQKNDLSLLQMFLKALEPLRDEIIKAYEKQQLKKT